MDMNLNYPAFPSLPSLLHEFDGVFSSSEGSTPADSPTFYKCGGESSEMKPVFHSESASDSYKVWWSDSLRSDSSLSPSQDLNQEIGVWEDMEMELDAMPYGSPCNRRSPYYAVTQWPTRDNTVSCSIPVSVARSSLYYPQPSRTSFGAEWRGSPPEDDLFGSASPLSSTASLEDANLPDGSHSSLGPQSLNYCYDSRGFPYLYRPSASSQPVPTVSPIAIASPNSPPSSPASASYSSSVLSSSLSCPPTPPTPVLLPELHQPRPARPIPIIPLSKLATACEKFYMPSLKSSSIFPKPRRSFDELESSDLQPPIFTQSDSRYPLFRSGQTSHDALCLQYSSDGKSDAAYPYFNNWSGHSR